MKKHFQIKIVLFLIIFSYFNTVAQSVSGRIVNQNGVALGNLLLQMYISSQILNTTTHNDGIFIFNNVNSVEEKTLPNGYFKSNNYPNPFNPSSTVKCSIPQQSNVKLKVFDVLGS